MKQRSKATISIYRLDEPIAEVLITPNSKVVYNLMEEHSMTLAFDSDKAYYFTIGDYVDDEIFGRFYIAEEQMPKRSGRDYQYNLRLVSWYWLWNNKRFMLTQNGVRKECSWHLTNTLSGQLDELVNNLRALGYKNPNYNVSGCADADKVQLMSYNGIGICDALKQMAAKWNCEWWVTGEEEGEEGFTIWFGKCSAGEIVDFTEGENIESMSIEKNSDTYANKIYVFGGKENIPPTYRKTLSIKATCTGGKYTLDKKLEPAMFNTSDQTEETTDSTFTLSYGERKDNGILINGKTYKNYIENGKTLKYTGERKSIKFSLPEVAISADEITVQGTGVKTSYVDGDGSEKTVYRFQQSFAVYIRATVKINGYRDDTLSKEVATSFGVVKEEETQFTASIKGVIPAVKMLASDFSAVGTDVQVEVMYGIAWNEDGYGNMGPIKDFANVVQTLTWVKSEDSKNNSTGYIPVISAESSASYMRLIVNIVGDVTSGYDIKFYNSSKTEIYESFTFTIDDDYTLGIPTAYYQSEYDNPASLYRIGERRLQLPVDGGKDGDWVCENGYIVKEGLKDKDKEKQISDMAVVFKDVHPTGKLYVKGIYKEERNTITVNDDGSKSTFKWYQYHLNLASVSGKVFRFKKTYILDNETLRIKFLPPTDIPKESDIYDKCKSNCKLSGMTFECGYNTQKSVQNADTGEYVTVVNDFAVVRNEEYGAMLPNEVLKPSEWDPCYLTGWNVKALGGSGIIAAAEEELMRKGFEYAKAIEEGQFTFRCSMMSDRMMTDGLYDIGQKVRINHASLKTGKKESRIIGYEYKLDIPYDTPKYIVGETEAYSRIKKLEKEITKITQ